MSDSISGGLVADILAGLNGNDVLTGGAGADKFVFNTPLNATNNVDTITDFSSAQSDKLMLDRTKIFTALPATLTATEIAVVGSGGATGSVATGVRLVYESSSGNLYYDSDGGTSANRTLFATINATTTPSVTHPGSLAATDFVLI